MGVDLVVALPRPDRAVLMAMVRTCLPGSPVDDLPRPSLFCSMERLGPMNNRSFPAQRWWSEPEFGRLVKQGKEEFLDLLKFLKL